MKVYPVLILTAILVLVNGAQAQNRTIAIDYTHEKGPLNTMFKECVGAGRANEGLRADWQKQLAQVKNECGFKYIRMHGLLTDDMGVYKEDQQGNPEYNYQYIDVLYDYILSIGMKPFVELGFMPRALASGGQTIFWWNGNVTPPKDYQKWEALIQNLVQHYTDRYGADEVKTWYFEVWNEPNLTPGFWSSTQDEYFKLYKYTAKAVKSVNPEYKIGGPATAGAAWVPETINYCADNQVAIDFVSTHTYGVSQGFLDEFGTTGTVLSKDYHSVSRDVLNSRRQISESVYPNLELHYTEWSSSYTPSDPIHDSYHQAAYILQKLKQSGDAPTSMSYWVFTDIFEEAGPRFTPFHGGFGLLNTQGIKKPAYFAYEFLNKLGGTELINTDSLSWACKNSNGDIQVLFWDFTITLPDSINNQQYYIQDLPAHDKGTVSINLEGIPEGNYNLAIYNTGYRSNDSHTAYIDMHRPSQLSKAQVAELHGKSSGKPQLVQPIRVGKSGRFSKAIPIRENDVFLLTLEKSNAN